MSPRGFGISAAIAATSLWWAPSQADQLAGISATPSTVKVNETVTITVTKTGSGDCNAVVEYGDGQQTMPFVLTNAGATYTYAYTLHGTFVIRVRGSGAADVRCKNPKTTEVTVNPLRPPAEPEPDPPFRPLPPNRGEAGDGSKQHLPKIVDRVFEPAEINGIEILAAPGVLAPGGRLHLKGVGFGSSGVIRIAGLPGAAEVDLVDVGWSESRVNGVIPTHIQGEPFTRHGVTVGVYNADLDAWSPPVAMEYERPFAAREITLDDPAVRVVACGDDGNVNTCNNINIAGESCVNIWDIELPFLKPPDPKPAIFGAHGNCNAAIGDDTGTDRYEVHLANGWFIFRVIEQTAGGTSDDESASFSSIPTGSSDAQISVDWVVSPGDHISYRLRLEAAGPIETSPF